MNKTLHVIAALFLLHNISASACNADFLPLLNETKNISELLKFSCSEEAKSGIVPPGFTVNEFISFSAILEQFDQYKSQQLKLEVIQTDLRKKNLEELGRLAHLFGQYKLFPLLNQMALAIAYKLKHETIEFFVKNPDEIFKLIPASMLSQAATITITNTDIAPYKFVSNFKDVITLEVLCTYANRK